MRDIRSMKITVAPVNYIGMVNSAKYFNYIPHTIFNDYLSTDEVILNHIFKVSPASLHEEKLSQMRLS